MGFFSRLFNSFGPKGIIDAQMDVFKKLKNKYPDKPKDELLNLLIISRVNAPCGPSSKSFQMSHYADLIDNNQKTLEDVIWAIVDYEYLRERKRKVINEITQLGGMKLGLMGDLKNEESILKNYMEEKVESIQ